MMIQNMYHVWIGVKGAEFVGNKQTNIQTLNFVY